MKDSLSRSVQIHRFGGPEVLTIEDVIVPPPSTGEVRLRIEAIGLNRTEVTFRSGKQSGKPAFTSGGGFPTHMGFEAAGEIDSIGPGVEGFAPGDRVALVPAYSVGDYGLYGEVSLAPARSLVKIPEGVSFEAAAACWVAFAAAWNGLIDIAHLSEGQAVLISAASSSVGTAAIQIARSVGAIPIALTRTHRKSDALRELGAAAVIATEENDIVANVMRCTGNKGADIVFDAVGGPAFAQLAQATAVGGKLIIYGALSAETTPLPIVSFIARRLTLHGSAMTAATYDDAKLAELKRFVGAGLASGAFKPPIAKIFPFENIADAHRYLEGGEQIGKVIVSLPKSGVIHSR